MVGAPGAGAGVVPGGGVSSITRPEPVADATAGFLEWSVELAVGFAGPLGRAYALVAVLKPVLLILFGLALFLLIE